MGPLDLHPTARHSSWTRATYCDGGFLSAGSTFCYSMGMIGGQLMCCCTVLMYLAGNRSVADCRNAAQIGSQHSAPAIWLHNSLSDYHCLKSVRRRKTTVLARCLRDMYRCSRRLGYLGDANAISGSRIKQHLQTFPTSYLQSPVSRRRHDSMAIYECRMDGASNLVRQAQAAKRRRCLATTL